MDNFLIQSQDKQDKIDRREIPSSIILENVDAAKSIFRLHSINSMDILIFHQDHLTEKQRQVFKYFYEMQYTQERIAGIMGISRGTVKDHVSAIRRKAEQFFFEKAYFFSSDTPQTYHPKSYK